MGSERHGGDGSLPEHGCAPDGKRGACAVGTNCVWPVHGNLLRPPCFGSNRRKGHPDGARQAGYFLHVRRGGAEWLGGGDPMEVGRPKFSLGRKSASFKR